MTLKTKFLAGTLAVAGLAVLAAAATWYFLIRSDAPPPVSLEDAIEAAGMPSPTPPTSSSQAPSEMSPSIEDGLAGEWQVVPGDATFAGYRVNQQVAGLGTETVVGRTGEVDGSLTFDGAVITGTEVTVDMTTLRSGESLRDSALRSEGLETRAFPMATFALTSPISVGEPPAPDMPVTQTASGSLTLHGVTRPVQIDLEAQLKDGRLVVVGSHEIEFADFDMRPPSGPASVLSVEDSGIMEVQLVFEKAA